MSFELKLAWRHLLSGGRQTALTIFAVGIAAMVVLFVQVSISGMQNRFRITLIGSLAHVTIKPADTLPQTLAQAAPVQNAPYLIGSDQQPRLQQRTDISQWEQVVQQVSALPGIQAIAPTVTGSAFVTRGSEQKNVTLTGGDPALLEQITPVQRDMLQGQWLGIKTGDLVLGIRLANELQLKLGDRVQLQSSAGVTQDFTVAGIFYAGTESDLNQVYMTLRDAQSLMAAGQDVSMIQIKLNDAYQADALAKQLKAALPYRVDSWMTDSGLFLNSLNSMTVIRTFLTAFVLLASAVAVSAIMIVSVLQKNRQIGILKSMGARDRQILIVFTLEGLGIAIAGAVFGVLLALVSLKVVGAPTGDNPYGGRADAVLPTSYDPALMSVMVLVVIAATVMATILPARQAARLNPIEVIRG